MICDFDDMHDGNHRLDLLQRLHEINPAFKATVFVIPALTSDRFLDELPDWLEAVPHGWLHPHPREAEDWKYEHACRVLDSCDHPRFVHGWKSPGWQISDGTYEALVERDWWVADQPYNDHRRPDGLRVHRLGDGDHWHGHVQDVCGNGLAETFSELSERVAAAESFEWVSEAVVPWRRNCHCGLPAARVEQPDPFDGRLDGYCDECAWSRCDCHPDQCPVKYGVAA